MPTQVYVVMGGYNYECESLDSMQLFDCKSTAEAYGQTLQENYDYVVMRLMPIRQDSAILAAAQ